MQTAPAGADTDAVAAVRSEAAALLGAGRSPLGMLLTTCKHTEATTPYHTLGVRSSSASSPRTRCAPSWLCAIAARPRLRAHRPKPDLLPRRSGALRCGWTAGLHLQPRLVGPRLVAPPSFEEVPHQPARGHLYVQSFAEDHPPRSVAGGCTQRTPAQGRPRRSAQAVRVSPLMTKATLLSWRHQWRRAVEPPPPPFRWAA